MVHPFDECYLISLKHGERDMVQHLVVKEQKPKLWLHMMASTSAHEDGEQAPVNTSFVMSLFLSLCISCTAALTL